MNKAQLIGRTGGEVEIFTFDDGSKVGNVSLATTRKWKDKQGEYQEQTEWHKLEIGGKLCDIFEKYVHKGDLIYIEGEIRYKKTKQDKFFTIIKVFNLEMLGSKSSNEQPTQQPQPTQTNEEDDLPF